MANILDASTIGGILTLNVDTNPTIEGLNAPIGSIASASDGSGLFYKKGKELKDWIDYSK